MLPYITKLIITLFQSEERARKLRADLAIEEYRGQELDRILKEIVPDPKISDMQRSRRGRRVGCFCLRILLFRYIYIV